jgi:hypothetical protein
MIHLKRMAMAACVAGSAFTAMPVPVSAGMLPTGVAAVKSADAGSVTQVRWGGHWGGGWGHRGWGGWGLGAGIAAGIIGAAALSSAYAYDPYYYPAYSYYPAYPAYSYYGGPYYGYGGYYARPRYRPYYAYAYPRRVYVRHHYRRW